MDFKRFGAFLLIVIVGFGLIGWTAPDILRSVRLGLDLKGGFEVLYIVEPLDATQELTHDVLIEAAHSIEDRANKNGAEEPEVTPEGKDRIRVKIAGVTDPEKIRGILKEPANLTFRSSDGTIELRGNDFVENAADVQFDSTTQEPIISIELKDKAKFYEITKRISQKPLPDNVLEIWLNEEMLYSPRVSQGIPSNQATIEGGYTITEANKLAATINLGALPVKLTEKYTQVVDATLGQASLDKTVFAGLIGSVFILLFMLFFYRVPGIIAVITLITYTWLLLIIFNLMNATLTLPGIAAFVLGIGMAVDANIITYERIKDELRSGKSILSSIKAGSKNSLRTILDANITTIIAAAVLFNIGTGAIKGFALVLIVSILASMITNVFFSRLLLFLLVRSNLVKKLSYFGVKEGEVNEL
ncbi:MAG: protein translocase subunit SecD [Paenibacillaceae bacterium]